MGLVGEPSLDLRIGRYRHRRYAVPETPESNKQHVWYGVIAAVASVP
jgi:hypothetical protein